MVDDVYWIYYLRIMVLTRTPHHIIFASFNSNTTGAMSGAELPIRQKNLNSPSFYVWFTELCSSLVICGVL